ncbi:MAG: hypothetical protein ABI836_10310 [Gemmatimonadota bacterium]
MLFLLAARSVAAQAGGFIKPDPKLDSLSASLRDDYLVFRDTLRAIDAASSRLTRDIRTASGALLLSRNRAVRAACANALASIDSARQNLLGSPKAGQAPLGTRTELDKTVGELRPALSRCVAEFDGFSTPAGAIAVRDAGARSASDAVLTGKKFERAAEVFLNMLGITVRPYGAGGPNPFAGSAN